MEQKEKIFLSFWCAALVVVALTSGILLSMEQRANVAASIERHAARVGLATVESGQTEPEQTPPAGHEKDGVRTAKVGIYLDQIWHLLVCLFAPPVIGWPFKRVRFLPRLLMRTSFPALFLRRVLPRSLAK